MKEKSVIYKQVNFFKIFSLEVFFQTLCRRLKKEVCFTQLEACIGTHNLLYISFFSLIII
ncbi:hypothetical protein BpHYR1_047991 [Brachionus plicatilis]|uniref:Uncharacterized protein n=1 Tax=Brachionus plicatilis TaxID=10195 RepID=A0A3M7QPL9_BRAPC|nr:hypothetical protein BpHYR1_047991 [Brachionus plicatilis]